MRRCSWARSELAISHHDREWGVPQHDDHILFEFLILEGAQAGLSWETILRKRENYRKAFDVFNPAKVAKYDARKTAKLLNDAGLIRNRLKIDAAIQNAQSFLLVQKEYGAFDVFLWEFVDGEPIQNRWSSTKRIPPRTALSELLSKDLRKRGFKFVGSTICYAFMQAVGMVNDHTVDCFRYRQVKALGKSALRKAPR